MTNKLELKSSHEVIDTVDVADVESIFYCKPTDPDILTVLMKDGKRLYCDEVCPVYSLQEEPVSEGLDEAASNYSEEHRIALMDYETGEIEMNKSLDILNAFKAGAEWQKTHLWKDAQGDDLPEYEREVVVFTQNFPDDAGMMMVAIGHRPTPEGYDGKSLATGEIKHYTPKTYDKGGWNIPDVKYWLDVELPKEMEE